MPDISTMPASSANPAAIPLPVSSLTSDVEGESYDTPDTVDSTNLAECASPISSASSQPPLTLYFAYGSNLSTTQMNQRCNSSRLYTSPLAVLHDYEWFIASRGYASVRPAKGKNVYGLLFELDEEAEYSLDLYEGVGRGREGCYYKEEISVNLLSYPPPCYYANLPDLEKPEANTLSRLDAKVKALVYIDCTDEEGALGDAYAVRLKKGVVESGELGLEIGDSFGKWMEQVMKAEGEEGGRRLSRWMVERESSGPAVKIVSQCQEPEIGEQGSRGIQDYHCC